MNKIFIRIVLLTSATLTGYDSSEKSIDWYKSQDNERINEFNECRKFLFREELKTATTQ